MEIVGKTLTTYQVDPAGDSLRLNFVAADDRPASVVLPVDCLRSLLMTLPGLIEQALKARYRDDTLKVVYPVGGWSLQAAAGAERLILTLSTPDEALGRRVAALCTVHPTPSGFIRHHRGGGGPRGPVAKLA